MTNFIVAAFMWSLVVVLSPRARHRRDNAILWAAIAIAVSFTTNINWVYLAASKTIPWPNGLDIAANVLLMVGIYYLSSSIRRGATGLGARDDFNERWIRSAAAGAVVLMLIFFSQIDAPVASTEFMLTYGNQFPAALYSITQYTYVFAVMAGVLVVCVRNVPRMRHRRFRIGFSLLALGCVAALALCAVVIWMDVAHLAGYTQLMRNLGLVYSFLYTVTIALLCIGLAIPPVGRLWLSLRLDREVHKVEPKVSIIWSRAVAENSSISLVTDKSNDPSRASALPDSISRMHRMVIEIHDWLNLHKDQLSDEERRTLAAAEDLCMQPGSRR
jgi:hypothetical protein